MSKITGGNNLIDPKIIIEKAGISERMRVADLGCGSTGHFVFSIAETIGSDGVMYAVDILKRNLDNIEHRAKQDNLKQIKTVWSNLEIFQATKIEASSLDAGLLINVLYQSDKRVEMMREAIRLVKKGGSLVIVDWNQSAGQFGPSLEERVNPDNLRTAGERLGLKLIGEFNAGQYHFGMAFQKL